MAGEADTFLLLILALIFPPAAVGLIAGCGADLCLNILLTLLGYFPGCIHAFWLALKRAEANERYGYRNWIYTGMGEYLPYDLRPPSTGQTFVPYGQPRGPPPPPPPPGQQPAGKAPPPSQAPQAVDQKQGGYGYTQPPTSTGGYHDQAPPQAPVDQKSGGGGGYLPPSAPVEQKYGYQVLPQEPAADQKPADVATAQGAAPADGA